MTITEALLDECRRQEENCAYTAVSFTIWLRCLRTIRIVCLIAPVVCGALATWKIVAQDAPVFAAVFTLLATLIPTAYMASETDHAIKNYADAAGELTNLRDRFRQAATVASQKPTEVFDAETKPLFDRLEKVRSRTLTPPEWCFKRAQKKIKPGDYRHDYDEASNAAHSL